MKGMAFMVALAAFPLEFAAWEAYLVRIARRVAVNGSIRYINQDHHVVYKIEGKAVEVQ